MAGTIAALSLAATLVIGAAPAAAQNRGAPPPAPATSKASAPIDLTGYWVSLVTEDWRFRMITPPKGDYQAVPLNPEGRRVADTWDAAADRAAGSQCKAYGAAAIMRLPGRLHITWQDDNVLKVETDAGTQTRLFFFAPAPKPAERTWQGTSIAQWERPGGGRGASPMSGSLKVVTTNMLPGYLRRNGVPYSENAVLTEYIDLAPMPSGNGQLLLVTAIVDDPQYLQLPFIVSSQFKKEADGSKWDPTPCE